MRHVLTLIWLTLAILGGCERAFAHAALVEAHPADGVVLEDTPTRARLRFNEPVSPLAFILTDAQGRTHRDLAVTSRNEVVEIGLPADLSRGSHILSFRVASGDGHPVSGSVVFSVGATTGTEVDRGNRRKFCCPPGPMVGARRLVSGLVRGRGRCVLHGLGGARPPGGQGWARARDCSRHRVQQRRRSPLAFMASMPWGCRSPPWDRSLLGRQAGELR